MRKSMSKSSNIGNANRTSLYLIMCATPNKKLVKKGLVKCPIKGAVIIYGNQGVQGILRLQCTII